MNITIMITYAIMNMFAENDFMYTLGFTIAALYILYFDIKIIKITIVCFIITNIAYISGCLMSGRMLSEYELDITSLVIEGCCVVVFCFILYLTTSTAIRINNKKLKVVFPDFDNNFVFNVLTKKKLQNVHVFNHHSLMEKVKKC